MGSVSERIDVVEEVTTFTKVSYDDFDTGKLSFSKVQTVKKRDIPSYDKFYILYDGSRLKLVCSNLYTKLGTGRIRCEKDENSVIINCDTLYKNEVIHQFACFIMDDTKLINVLNHIQEQIYMYTTEYDVKFNTILKRNDNDELCFYGFTNTNINPNTIIETLTIDISQVILTNCSKWIDIIVDI